MPEAQLEDAVRADQWRDGGECFRPRVGVEMHQHGVHDDQIEAEAEPGNDFEIRQAVVDPGYVGLRMKPDGALTHLGNRFDRNDIVAPLGEASTIVDATGPQLRIVRDGGVTRADIEKVVGADALADPERADEDASA